MRLVRIQEEYDEALAKIIRDNLKANGLDIPGTVYFDPELNHLSDYYLGSPKADYYVALDEQNHVVGGIGLDEYPGLEHCAELQKLYLADSVKGHGYGYELITWILQRAREMGYQQMYLETHHNLKTAIHMYEKSGFHRMERPAQCVHGTMDIFYIRSLVEQGAI